MSNLVGAVSLTDNQQGVYLGRVNLDNLNLQPDQIVYSADGINMSGLNIGDGLQQVLDELTTVGNANIQLVSNSVYVNDNVGVTPIQTGIDLSTQADVIYISSGSYGEPKVIIADKYNIALQGPDVGNTITELINGLNIQGTSELIRVCNLQIKPDVTSSNIKGVGRHYFKNVVFSGSASQTHTIEIGKSTTKYMTFMNCEFDQYCIVNISSALGAPIYFINCNFGGCTFSLNNTSPLLVIMSNCSGLTAYPSNTKVTLVGLNVLTTGASQVSTTNVNLSTINGAAYPPSGGVSIANQANKQIPYETATNNSLNSSANLTFNDITNTLATTNISATNLTITNINGNAYPPAQTGLSATNQAVKRVPYCTSTTDTLNCEAGFEYDQDTDKLYVPAIQSTNIQANSMSTSTMTVSYLDQVETINGNPYPPVQSGVVVDPQYQDCIPFCTATNNSLTIDTQFQYNPPSKTLYLLDNNSQIQVSRILQLQSILFQSGYDTANSVNEVLTTNGAAGFKLTPIGGENSNVNVYYESGQQTPQAAASSLILFNTPNPIYGKLYDYGLMWSCVFNFTVSSNNCILTVTLTDRDVPTVYTQSLTNNGHHQICLNIFQQANYNGSIYGNITFAVDNGTISVDANDYYSVQIYNIKNFGSGVPV